MRVWALLFLLASTAFAQLEAPRVGCFWDEERAFEVTGVRGAFLLTRVDACLGPANPWRIVGEDDGQWLLRIDPISGAVQSQSKLGGGAYAVWLDGAVVELDSLGLPTTAVHTLPLSERWMLLLLENGTRLILDRRGVWFLLPGGAQ